MKSRQFIRLMTPPLVHDWRLRLLDRSVRYYGRPLDWRQAKQMSGGYDDGSILARVVEAARSVTAGRAKYERDSVEFRDTVYPFAVLSALLRAAAMNANHLDVIDFGGSLGSMYHQCRRFLDCVSTIDWRVIEQRDFVAAGRHEFGNKELSFAHDFGELPWISAGCIIVAGSSLEYLEDPSAMLAEFTRLPARHLVIDRTPVSEEADDRLCIQHVPKSIYPASYPCWILSRRRLLAQVEKSWRVVSDFVNVEGRAHTDDGLEFAYRGLILEKLS